MRNEERLQAFADGLYALPARFAGHLAGTIHPYDVADAITDLLATEPIEEPLAPWEAELLGAVADERLAAARQALIATGYFTEDQVGQDIAPRITELWSHCTQADDSEADR